MSLGSQQYIQVERMNGLIWFMINDIVKLSVFLLNECVLFVVPFLQYKEPILHQPRLFAENRGKLFPMYAQ